MSDTVFFGAILVGLGVLGACALVGCTSVERIEAGNVGIQVQLAGAERGVSSMQLKSGWVIYNPLVSQVVEFPVSVQNTLWTGPEAITFSSAEGVNVSAAVGMNWHVEPNLAPKMYARFRQADLAALAHGYLHNTIRQSFNDIASKMTIQDIYGSGKDKLVADATEHCRSLLTQDGFVIDQLGINGSLALPESVVAAINRTIEATQQAIQSENQVRQVKAQAEQAITKAHGEAEATRQRAQGEADAMLIQAKGKAESWRIEGQGQAAYNNTVKASLTPEYLKFETITKWNGVLPHIATGTSPTLLLNTQ